ncbi:rCG24095, isoform CRA_c [Rattus norvegicus]|uniref:RCG24095, isoform CRA_c n=1 Tax=Rattus norvegicus TaxID=10116 RepID=A6KAY0_RAT|nr:rCG24095, isoform CRA_c [Rattus norvegicus]
MAAPEEQDLTQEQTEKLLQFQDLTGIDSMEQCRLALEQHNWNMEAAVQDRLNEQEGVPSVFNPPPSRPLQVNTADHRIYSYVVSRPQPRASVVARIASFHDFTHLVLLAVYDGAAQVFTVSLIAVAWKA